MEKKVAFIKCQALMLIYSRPMFDPGSIEKGRYKWRGTPAWLAYYSLAKLEAEIKEQCTEIRERCTERTLKNCEHLEYTSQ